MVKIESVGVLGCGLMGSGIAQVCATAGFPTTVVEVSPELVERGLKNIQKNLDRQREKGALNPEQHGQIYRRIRASMEPSALAGCDLVIEAIIENLPQKLEAFARLDALAKPGAIFASNTSSLSITEMMKATRRPERFVGLHFFNPVPAMRLVEVVRTVATDPEVFQAVVEFAGRLSKTPLQTSDRSGFIVNRLLVPYLLDAVRAYEEGVGTITDLDNGMKLGCGHPMGPFTLLDFVGLDTTYYIAHILFEEFREKRFAPPGLLKRLVMAGWHGRKTGRGFYDYADPKNPKPLDSLLR